MFSIFKKDITNTIPAGDITLKEAYTYVTSDAADAAKAATEHLRDETDPDKKSRIKNTEFKFATFSGTFSERRADKLNQFSGFICIDIDKVDDSEVVKEKLKSLHNIKPALVFISPSGNGIKVIYRVSIKSAEHVGLAYTYIAKMIEDELNIEVDQNPKSVASACYLPWDPDAYLNEDAAIVEIPLEKLSGPKQDSFTHSDDNELEKVRACVDYIEKEQINIAEDYEDWYLIGFSLAALGEAGRDPYHIISKISKKYNYNECDEMFNDLLQRTNNDVSLGTFYHHCKYHNLPLSEILKPFNPNINIVNPKDNYWDDNEQAKHNKRTQDLLDNPGHPLIKQVFEEYGVEHGTLCDYNVGLGNFTTVSRQTKDALFATYGNGCLALFCDGEQLCTEDLPGSSPYDSFFGLNNALERKTVVIVNNPLDAMYLDSMRNDIDVISLPEPSNPVLSAKQREILREKSAYWKNIYILKPAVKGSEKKNALSYCRLYADLLPVDSTVFWVNFGQNDKSLHQATQGTKALTEKQIFPNATVVWNSATKKNKFWYIAEEKKKTLCVDELRLSEVLDDHGFVKVYQGNSTTPTLLKVTDNVVDELSNSMIMDYVRAELIPKMSKYVDDVGGSGVKGLKTRRNLMSTFLGYRTKLHNDNFKGIFPPSKLKFLREDKDTAYLFYANGVVRVTKDKCEFLKYSDLDGHIWKDQILHRDIQLDADDTKKSQFERFVRNVTDDDPDRFASARSILGYLLSTFKDRANAKAVILTDEHISPLGHANGGTGKSIYGSSIKYMRKQRYLPGKNVDFNRNFAFMSAKIGDQNIFIDDAQTSFDLEPLFNVITNDMQVEAKYQQPFDIPFEESPKFLIATNSVIKGSGTSYSRRQIILEFSDYYLNNPTPDLEFGGRFFDDWDEEEWNRFDRFMINCLQDYLKNGLYECKLSNYKTRKIRHYTSAEFFKWAESNLEADVLYSANVLFDGKNPVSKIEEAPINSSGNSFPCFLNASSDLHENQIKTFNKWLRTYTNFKNWALNEVPYNGYTRIEFTKK